MASRSIVAVAPWFQICRGCAREKSKEDDGRGYRNGGQVGVQNGGHSTLERWMEMEDMVELGGRFSGGQRDGGYDGDEERKSVFLIFS